MIDDFEALRAPADEPSERQERAPASWSREPDDDDDDWRSDFRSYLDDPT